MYITLFQTHIPFMFFLRDVTVGGILKKAVRLKKKGVRTSGGLRYTHTHQLISILYHIYIYMFYIYILSIPKLKLALSTGMI